MVFKDFFSSSGGEQIQLSNFDRVPYEEHLYDIILNLGQLFRRGCCLKIFLVLALDAILFSRAKLLKQFLRQPYEEHLSENILT